MEQQFDVVINVGPNDIGIIGKQVEFTRKNITGKRNIYIVTLPQYIEQLSNLESCIVIDETIFPFNYNMIHTTIGVNSTPRNGWYLQQLLKLYAGLVIPNILDRWLVIDADTFFLQPTQFIEDGKCLYAYGTENHKPYFDHMSRLLPGLHKCVDKSGICHHMIFEKRFMTELFDRVEEIHKKPFWHAFLSCVAPSEYAGSGASEYEIYFNYMLINNSNNIKVRHLSWTNVSKLVLNSPYNYISYHHHSRH
jgi:hypothetical protein